MTSHFIRAPWSAPLTVSEHSLIFYFLLLAGMALFVGLLRTWVTRGEVGTRYRTAVVARLGVMSVSTLSYLVLLVEFVVGYHLVNGVYRPDSNAIFVFAPRYVEWSVSVPLLVVELLSVCAVCGVALRRTRAVAGPLAFLMIFLGFLGAIVIANGTSTLALALLGGASAMVWIIVNVLLVRAVSESFGPLTNEAGDLLHRAAVVLLSGWAIYPLIYLIQIFAFGGGWSTTIQIALCVADIGVKLGFSGLVHRIAKLRTAEDVRAGVDMHPESIWISSVKQSDAGVAGEVFLEIGETIHTPRHSPVTNFARAVDANDQTFDLDRDN